MTVTYSAAPVLRWGLAQHRFTLTESFIVTWNRGITELTEFTVLAGFSTDLASIPRVFQSIVPKVGRHIQPAIAHDWCYGGNTDLTKADADLLFLEGMEASGVWWLRRQAMYWAVRAGGKGHWAGGAEV